jgi:CSLREA domain-containing protein
MMISTLMLPAMAIAKSTGVRGIAVSAPSRAMVGELVTLTVDLPADVAAIDGRVVMRHGAADIVGVAPSGDGTAFRPEAISGGFAFGAFGLASQGADSTVRLVVEPLLPGRLQLRLIIDTTADAHGNRIELKGTVGVATIRVSGGDESLDAPEVNGRSKPRGAADKTRELVPDGKFNRQDLDAARAAWLDVQATGDVCASGVHGDANQDGCVDIADVQRLNALLDEPPSDDNAVRSTALLAAPLRTFVVTSALDTADAAPGNGTCADSMGRCTLRAAMTEADYLQGEDRIEFNLPGTAPVTIQLGSYLGVSSRTGGVVIDGYTQPGAAPNTAVVGSNAVPGVNIRGTGVAARQFAFYITSANNTIRGLVIGNTWRGIFLDGADAHDNRIIGNWVGFTGTGANSTGGQYGILVASGASRNLIGTPDLGDRNVIGNWGAGVDHYGPGVNGNVTQNNLFCMRPTGLTATCNTAVDHNFGPKDGLFGGTGPNERNIIGPTTLQGIEYSHGWNPANHGDEPTWQINNNRAIGNWVGFRADGSYNASYRSGLNFSGGDNAQGINVYDGTNDNIVEGNFVASVYDGIQVMAPNAMRNIIRNNIIGRSPLGEAAPLTGWGVVVRWSSTFDVVEANTIQNATKGGIGLLNTNNNGGGMAPAYFIRLTRNIITATNGPAIDLFGVAGPDPNDPGDGDEGANSLLNTPSITSATTSGFAGTASAGATVEVYRASRPVGSFGLPIEYLGSAITSGSGAWTLARSMSVGDVVTALQIHPGQSTSELSANVLVGASPATSPSITSASSTTFVTGTAGSFSVTTTGSPTPSITRTGTLPSGVTFTDNGNGTGTLAGTPAAGSAGTYPITFTAANGVPPNATQNFTLTVGSPPPGAPFAQDSFSRTVVNGWGSASTGGSYTLVGTAADFDVPGSTGTMTMVAGSNRAAVLTGVSATNVDLNFKVSTDKAAVGGNQFIYAIARRVSATTEYRAQLRFATNGAVFIQGSSVTNNVETGIGSAVQVPGLTHAPGAAIRMRAQFTGTNPTTIRIRAWLDGTTEPTTWQYTATNSAAALQTAGGLGLRVYVGGSITNAPVIVSFDDLVGATVTP